MSRRRVLFGSVAAVAAAAVVATVTAVWPGLDARDTPPVESSVWALQIKEGTRYARVNTAVGELDTVRTITNPSSIAQNGDEAYAFSESSSRLTRIDPAAPVDLDEDAVTESPMTPPGTVDVATAGEYVAYRTDSGSVFGGVLATGSSAQVDPRDPDDEDAPEYTAAAMTVTDAGLVFSYSDGDAAVLTYSIPEGRVIATDPVADVGDEPALTAVGDTWFLFDESSDTLWQDGGDEPRTVDTLGAVTLSRGVAAGDEAYLADEGGLVRLPVDGGEPERIVGGSTDELGYPARPVVFQGAAYGAWLGVDTGTLWRQGAGTTSLDFGDRKLGDQRRGAFVASGDAMILNETRTGWVWTMPDGDLVPSSQAWVVEDEADKETQPSDEQAEVVLDPKPPVAVNDAFGVRRGALTTLPVLLNDHDPNEDVLSIDPASLTPLDPAFGTIGVTDGGGRLAVTVSPGASGTQTFRYRVTDGTSDSGLYSETATVTLTVVDDRTDTAPVWCGVEKCLAPWPEPEVKPGGAVTVPVLDGWVDPEGDPALLLDATVPDGQGAAAVTQQGDVVYQHADPSLTTPTQVPVEVTVADTRGKTTQRLLKVTVTPSPKLRATSFAQVATLGTDLSVDVTDHVTGTTGDIGLKNVRVMDDVQATATVAVDGTSFDFSAREAGTYRVRYTVNDGISDAEGTARITLLPTDAPAQLATAPVVAFLRPQEDAAIDVLDAVSNPTGRVLLVTGVSGTADEGATLQVDTVGQDFVRVTGTTPSGDPGRLGVVDYTVTDGSDDAGATITGQMAVYLLPPALDLPPIAVDDAVVVRAGAQIDIPALANDVAPSGGSLTLDPSSIRSSSDDALAFASGSTLRYLAPSAPGSYTIDYDVYSAGAPALTDTATVTVTVIGDESNRAPRPRVLEGRVLSGQSTRIAFDTFGVDPDGDDVTLDRITSQPKNGTAAISPDGAGIVFTSKPGSPGGQETFSYRVRDSAGEIREGRARVGVLDAQANPSPVTFTDYVQVTAGEKSVVHVSPLDNDIDPSGGTLELSSIEPNLAETFTDGSDNPEYAKWKKLVGEIADDRVVISAGAKPGTMSFLYDVESSSGNTARGLIVVKVVREVVPDYPVVADTTLTSETRDTFATGVDVLAKKVTWTGGDVSTLTLGSWNADDVRVSGRKIRGTLGEGARIVAFSVSGALSDGQEATTYAFVRVPAADDTSISLRPGLAAREVKERESVVFDMRDLVVMPKGATLEVSAEITASRAQATCSLDSGTRVTYAAGAEAPWTDACVVPVRVAGAEDWTYLSVPIRVIALDPVPVLRPASITVQPGESATFDLDTMVAWQGREDWDALKMTIDSGTGGITAVQDGRRATISVGADATPGREAALTVAVSSHADVVPSRLIVRVGPLPSTLPRAGTAQLQCTAASGTSCSVTVVGADGEVNPFPETPLTLTSVSATSVCTGVSFAVGDGGAVVASWDADAPGGSCTASFTLEDAQGRATGGDRRGTLLFDLQGFPRGPTALRQAAYGDGTLTLAVEPGVAASSYPAVQSFTVTRDGTEVATCSAAGVCPAISVPNGEKRIYRAVANNAVGASRTEATASAWAYNPPAAPASMVATPVVTDNGAGKVVSLTISGIDAASTDRLEISAPSIDTQVVTIGSSQTSITLSRFAVGSNSPVRVTATPVTRFDIPSGQGPSSTKGQSVSTNAHGIGAPTNPVLTLTATTTSFDRSTVTAKAAADPGGADSSVVVRIAGPGESCAKAPVGGERVFENVKSNAAYTYSMCATAVDAGGTTYGSVGTERSVDVLSGDDAPTGFTFTVDPEPVVSGWTALWRIAEDPKGDTPPGWFPVFHGLPSSIVGADPGITVQWESEQFHNRTVAGPVTAASSSPAPTQVQVRWNAVCVRGAPAIATDFTAAAGGVQPTVTFDPSKVVYLDKDGKELPVGEDGSIPADAVRADGLTMSLDWKGTGLGLHPVERTIDLSCSTS